MAIRVINRRVRVDIPEGAGGDPIFVKIGSIVTNSTGQDSRTWSQDNLGVIRNLMYPATTDLFTVTGGKIILR